jgi:hypothetical protein
VRRRRIELPVNECGPGRRASVKRRACATSVAVVVVVEWSDVDRRVGLVVPGPGPETDDRQQWLQTARSQYGCRKRCRSATRSVSQADLANGLANRSGRAVYLSETRSDVRSSGARSRLREWLGRAALVKMCAVGLRRIRMRVVGAFTWAIFVKRTRRPSEYGNNAIAITIDRRRR